MTTRNSITGDKIQTKVAVGEAATNYDNGWEALQRAWVPEEVEVTELPNADNIRFLAWIAHEHYRTTKGYTGVWDYIINQYEQETGTTPDQDLLDAIIKGESV